MFAVSPSGLENALNHAGNKGLYSIKTVIAKQAPNVLSPAARGRSGASPLFEALDNAAFKAFTDNAALKAPNKLIQ
jgi:hypothetical protein